MRWLLVGLLISVAALLAVAGSALRYVRRQRQSGAGEAPDAVASQSGEPGHEPANAGEKNPGDENPGE